MGMCCGASEILRRKIFTFFSGRGTRPQIGLHCFGAPTNRKSCQLGRLFLLLFFLFFFFLAALLLWRRLLVLLRSFSARHRWLFSFSLVLCVSSVVLSVLCSLPFFLPQIFLAISILDGVEKQLDPNLDVLKTSLPYALRAVKSLYIKNKSAANAEGAYDDSEKKKKKTAEGVVSMASTARYGIDGGA